jgi:RNA polymerase sigma factor (sigma-70 family)
MLHEDDRAKLLQDCRAEVERLKVQYDWRLLSPEDWARRVFERVIAGSLAGLRPVAMHVYSQALHAACSGAEGGRRQNHGYEELFRYLYAMAHRRHRDIAEDATQRAIEQVFALFSRCRAPGTFLAFGLQQLQSSISTIRRQERRFGAEQALGTIERRTELAEAPDQRQADLAASIISDELRTRFEQLSVEFLREHPRAAQQLDALRLKYIDGLDEQAISRLLGKPTSSVYVLRSRAIEKLREDPSWRALAVEFGILPEV